MYVTCMCKTNFGIYCAQVWHYTIPDYLYLRTLKGLIQFRAMKIIDPSLSYNDALAVFDIPTLSIFKAWTTMLEVL